MDHHLAHVPLPWVVHQPSGSIEDRETTMASWSTSLITLAAVTFGALLSFASTRLTDRTRWQREENLRWDAMRQDAYREFASALLKFINIALRINAHLGFPVGVQPLDAEDGLPALASAGTELNIKWETILLLGGPDAIMAAKHWQDEAFHLEHFARQLRNDAAEFTEARQGLREARRRFYSAARADLKVTSGDIPADFQAPGKWTTLTEPAPEAHTPTTPEL
jgi:hypothetical protein